MSVVLQAKDLVKFFYSPSKIQTLNKVDLTAHQGETIAIMGRSGEGKSTLLQILGTLDSACSGSLEIAGQAVTSFSKNRIRNQHLSFIFQSFHLLEDCTALENVLMPARIARKTASKEYGMQLLEHVGMASRANFNTKLLSGGEKQRVAIARSLCNDPDLILADEPSGNLDRQTATGIHQLLLDFANQKNKTLIIVTHDEELAKLCHTRYTLINQQLVSSSLV